ITSEIAAAPFLWILPLALYLLTFVALFRDRPWISQGTAARFAPFAVVPLATGLADGSWAAAILVNIAAFVLLALVCHGELYRRRPATPWLTEFYLWTALGGVCGGLFAALLAPNIFTGTWEYQILMVAALLALPAAWDDGWRPVVRVAASATAVVVGMVALRAAFPGLAVTAHALLWIGLLALAALMLVRRHRPAELAPVPARR